ncbi:NAD(P)H-binding protein [Blastococcus sp. TML/M2B]|uniref:NAD-dependent epimerase/dehydratase family protein n=1 Tax=unclassified Blastococcus TaxID=2619396 RepID=UPI00190AF777|nr:MULTISPECIES: NAD-dependent epimerase/dehydratase family protein [unclassified Blastococcus]MBN1092835.1 NAD(P)H-binding protein [Blastococcus sp. TML/M2B]MBN1097055.1 NAD(P)H-binding protein [Blastococcus sp. TML/C7B]
MTEQTPVVVVTGANGLVGTAVCRALADRGARVRAVVRRPGGAPALDGVEEAVGDFADASFAREVTRGADAVVTTVHPMASSREVQHRVGAEGTAVLARAARDAGVARLVHVSTAAVYDRSTDLGDVAEDGALAPEGSGAYPDSKNATDAALAEIDGLTVVLVRPPAILGAGETSVWNTLRPRAIGAGDRRANPDQTWSWVHVDDLAAFIADVASGAIATADAPARGPVAGATTPVIVAGEPATLRDYIGTVAEALGVEPEWTDEPAWTGRLLTDRAHGWGWSPRVGLAQALDELRSGLRR